MTPSSTWTYVAARANVPWAALAPIILIGIGFVAYCLWDLSRSDTRYLPKWAWAIITILSIPVGGILYLIVGRKPR